MRAKATLGKVDATQLVAKWKLKADNEEDQELLAETSRALIQRLSLRRHDYVELTEWIHGCELRKVAPSYHAASEVTESGRLRLSGVGITTGGI